MIAKGRDTMKVYDEGSGETREVEASTPEKAAEIAHAQTEDGSGNPGTYCVERMPGKWQRFTVSTRYEAVHTTRNKGDCDPPEVDDDE